MGRVARNLGVALHPAPYGAMRTVQPTVGYRLKAGSRAYIVADCLRCKAVFRRGTK